MALEMEIRPKAVGQHPAGVDKASEEERRQPQNKGEHIPEDSSAVVSGEECLESVFPSEYKATKCN